MSEKFTVMNYYFEDYNSSHVSGWSQTDSTSPLSYTDIIPGLTSVCLCPDIPEKAHRLCQGIHRNAVVALRRLRSVINCIITVSRKLLWIISGKIVEHSPQT